MRYGPFLGSQVCRGLLANIQLGSGQTANGLPISRPENGRTKIETSDSRRRYPCWKRRRANAGDDHPAPSDQACAEVEGGE